MRIERHALNLPVSRATMPLDPAVDARRQPDRRPDQRPDLDGVERADPWPRDGSRHDDGRRSPDQSRDRRARRRRLVREPAALRRLRRDVADSLRHRAQGQAAQANAGRLPDPRDRGVSGRSRGRSTKSSSSAIRRCAIIFFRQNVYSIGQNPYRSITEIEMAEGRRTTTSLTETGRRCLLPIHPEARVYGLPIISGHVGADAAACMLAVGLARGRAAGRDHGHRHEHRAHPRQQGPDPGGVVPGGSGVRRRRDRLRHARTRRRDRGRARSTRQGSSRWG